MKIHQTKAARKDYVCQKCRQTIHKGDSYIWWEPIDQGTMRWHTNHGEPPMSLRVSSEHMKKAYEATEIVLDFLTKMLDIVENHYEQGNVSIELIRLNEASGEAQLMIEEVAEAYYVSANNVESRFGETTQVQECRVKASKIEAWMAAMDALSSDAYEVAGMMLGMKNQEECKQFVIGFIEGARARVRTLKL